jgi:hypothetical protein
MAGNSARAREHMLMAQRFVAAAGGDKPVRERADAEAKAQADADAARAELEERLLKLLPIEAARYAKAIERGEVEAYLAEQHTCRGQKWRDWFWWDELHQARAQYPPYGFRDRNNDDGSEDCAFLNACLVLFAERPGWRERMERL